MNIQMAGIRNVKDALMCVDCGVNIIGLLVGQAHTSDDFISKELAREIKLALPKDVKTTLITHLEDDKKIIEIAKFIDVDYIQLHSYITEDKVANIRKQLPNKKLLRLIHIGSEGDILNDISNMKYVDFYFTDSINTKTNQFGGIGLKHNIDTDRDLVKKLDKPVFIAGGLNPDNVAAAIKHCNPYGVDVNSGCRAIDGSRDREKVLAFVKNASEVN